MKGSVPALFMPAGRRETYREIVAFSEGKSLDEIEKARESGKRPYQKVALAMGSALLGVIATAFMIWLLS